MTESAESPTPTGNDGRRHDLVLPIDTARLRLRAPLPSDAPALHARRSEPSVARWQSWAVPFPRERAEAIVTEASTRSGPTPGEWWMLTVEAGPGTAQPGALVGDVAIHLDPSATIAQLGYTLAADWWGRGYATEAAAATIDALLAGNPDLVRIEGRTHPDNLASARVLEQCGMQYEGRTRLSFPPRPGDEAHSDDVIYGLTRDDRARWVGRNTDPAEEVTLIEVSNDNLRDVIGLSVHQSQDHLVAPVLESLAEATHPPVRDGRPAEVLYRAVAADGEIVGFLMLGFRPGRPAYLWRFLVDRFHQRRGIGRRALDLVVAEVRRRGDEGIAVSWVTGVGSPDRFYLGYGFEATGEVDEDGEVYGDLAFDKEFTG